MMKRLTHTERIMTTKQGVQTYPDTEHADAYQQALEQIEHAPPSQARKIAQDTLNKQKRPKRPDKK